MKVQVGSDVFGLPTIENFKKNGVNAGKSLLDSRITFSGSFILEFVFMTDKANTATATITVAESGIRKALVPYPCTYVICNVLE